MKKVYCSNCGQEYLNYSDYENSKELLNCKRCHKKFFNPHYGKRIEKTKTSEQKKKAVFCPHCGEQQNIDTTFVRNQILLLCDSCGKKFKNPIYYSGKLKNNSVENNKEARTQISWWKKQNEWVRAFTVCGTICLILCFAIYQCSESGLQVDGTTVYVMTKDMDACAVTMSYAEKAYNIAVDGDKYAFLELIGNNPLYFVNCKAGDELVLLRQHKWGFTVRNIHTNQEFIIPNANSLVKKE